MIKITIVAVGKVREKFIKEAVNEYSKRLSRFCTVEIIEVEDEQVPVNLSPAQEEQIKKKEGERILKKIGRGTVPRSAGPRSIHGSGQGSAHGSVVIALDMHGLSLDSEAFAERLNKYFLSGNSHLIFIIGGSIGLDDDVIKSADLKLSLSSMTFPHQLVRVILLEQIYRAFKIINNEVYHK